MPETVSPECTVVSLMSTERICGGAFGGSSIGVAVGVGCADALGEGAAVEGVVAAGAGRGVAAAGVADAGRGVARPCGSAIGAGEAAGRVAAGCDAGLAWLQAAKMRYKTVAKVRRRFTASHDSRLAALFRYNARRADDP